MSRGSCALGCIAGIVLIIGASIWLNFALDYERERPVSPDGKWIASAYVNGAPLTAANEKVHVWRWWQPHFRWLGCEILDAQDEAPVKLIWNSTDHLTIQHGFRPHELNGNQTRCGPILIFNERSLPPYS